MNVWGFLTTAVVCFAFVEIVRIIGKTLTSLLGGARENEPDISEPKKPGSGEADE